jgi:two-component system sensor histidine kinase CpxA
MSPTLSAGGLFFDFTPWLWAGGGVLLFSVLWWVPFVGSITRSIRLVTVATEQVAEGRFEVAVNERRGDELGRLGGAVKRMAGRLEGFVTGQKRFLGDIAHELCTPLARMEMALGVLEQRADARQLEYVNDVRDEVRHMSGLVNELLSFSKASLKARELPLTAVSLRALAAQVIAREAAASDAIEVEVPDELTAKAEPELLARAVGNLVRNALRYAGHAGPIRLSAAARGAEVILSVTDEGPGVPTESLTRLTEPFYRPDAARTREQGGVGLGLAIVKSCVEACRGQLTFRNRSPRGFEAEIRLERA